MKTERKATLFVSSSFFFFVTCVKQKRRRRGELTALFFPLPFFLLIRSLISAGPPVSLPSLSSSYHSVVFPSLPPLHPPPFFCAFPPVFSRSAALVCRILHTTRSNPFFFSSSSFLLAFPLAPDPRRIHVSVRG